MRSPTPGALLVVDVQNDFCAGGALAVPDGDAVVPVINRVARAMAEAQAVIVASRDWHPRDARHFAINGGVWPVHCVAGTPGAQFHPGLDLPDSTLVVTKGDTRDADGYSAFDGQVADGRPLADVLRARGVHHVVVSGLATDYCVKHSALDARRAGFDVTLLTDAIRGVELSAGDSQAALDEMASAGIAMATAPEILAVRSRLAGC